MKKRINSLIRIIDDVRVIFYEDIEKSFSTEEVSEVLLVLSTEKEYVDITLKYNNDYINEEERSILDMYFSEVNNFPLLKPEEEKQLFLTRKSLINEINDLKEKIDNYELDLNDLKNIKKSLAVSKRKLDNIESKIITSNLRLVIYIASKYKISNIDFLDIIQEGNMGLTKAMDKYNVEKGFKFSTYAVWWIRQAITRFINKDSSAFKVPDYMMEKAKTYKKDQELYRQKYGEEPDKHDMLEEYKGKYSKEDIKQYEELILELNITSLDVLVGYEQASTLGEFIEDTKSLPVEKIAVLNSLKESLIEVLTLIPEKEARILRLRYGLSGEGCKTINEVAEMLGISIDRARNLENTALRRIRHPKYSRNMKDLYDDLW